jgi:hypothetical protein
MPKVRYTYREVGATDSFREEDILPPGMDIELRAKQMVMVWNEKAEKNGEPERELVKAEVIDPTIHEHVWTVTISKALTGKTEYIQCTHCPVEATRVGNGPAVRIKKYESNFYESCREKLPKIKGPTFK